MLWRKGWVRLGARLETRALTLPNEHIYGQFYSQCIWSLVSPWLAIQASSLVARLSQHLTTWTAQPDLTPELNTTSDNVCFDDVHSGCTL